jgi:hypothetical protein
MRTITVIKQDYLGKETLRYPGKLLKVAPHEIVIEMITSKVGTAISAIQQPSMRIPSPTVI